MVRTDLFLHILHWTMSSPSYSPQKPSVMILEDEFGEFPRKIALEKLKIKMLSRHILKLMFQEIIIEKILDDILTNKWMYFIILMIFNWSQNPPILTSTISLLRFCVTLIWLILLLHIYRTLNGIFIFTQPLIWLILLLQLSTDGSHNKTIKP